MKQIKLESYGKNYFIEKKIYLRKDDEIVIFDKKNKRIPLFL